MENETTPTVHRRFTNFFKRLRRFGLKSLIFGIGIGIVLLIAFFYFNRPPSWNKQAITATFDFADTNSADNIEFNYVLKNNTDQDYNVNLPDEIEVLADLQKESSLISSNVDFTFGTPIFVPAHQTLEFSIVCVRPDCNYYSPYESTAEAAGATKADFAAYSDDVADYVKDNLRNLSGITLFDTENHYEIFLPDGWINVSSSPSALGMSSSTSSKDASDAGEPPCPAGDPLGLFTSSTCQALSN